MSSRGWMRGAVTLFVLVTCPREPWKLEAQSVRAVPELPTIPMAPDRVEDSYKIYSMLIPLGETAGKGWPHSLWLVQDTTIGAVPDGEACIPEASASKFSDGMNPHVVVHAPADNQQDFKEVLDDFDRHCHDRVLLQDSGWRLNAPLRLLNKKEQGEFQLRNARAPGTPGAEFAEKYKGAPAMYGFSEVYFNAHHTVALVYATHYCGGLCGEGFWVAFGYKDGLWRRLKWSSQQWIS